MTGFRKVMKDLVSVSLSFVFLYNVIWAMAASFYGDALYRFMVLAVPFFLMYFIRFFAKKGYVFLIATALLCLVALFMLGYLQAWGAVVFFIVFGLAHSVYVWINGEIEAQNAHIAVFLVLNFFLFLNVSTVEAASAYQSKMIVTCLMFVCLTILYQQMDSLDFKLHFQETIDGQKFTTKKLVKTNNMMMLVFTGFVMVVGFLSVYMPLHLIGRFISWLGSLLGNFLLRFAPDTGAVIIWIPDELEVVDIDVDLELGEEGFTDPGGITIADVLLIIFFSTLVLFVLYVVVKLIVAFIYAALKKIKSNRKSEKLGDDGEEVAIGGSLFDDLLDLLPRFKKAKHPIRRAYENKVNHHIRLGVLIENHDTTDKIFEKIRVTEDISELTTNYEIVRYGREA